MGKEKSRPLNHNCYIYFFIPKYSQELLHVNYLIPIGFIFNF